MLNKILSGVETVAIGGHIRPDGDCAGSCMGMYLYLTENYPEKQVDIYLEDLPDSFSFLKDSDVIRHEIVPGKQYDLFICQDCGDLARLGFSAQLFENAVHTFCIDHHISNQSFAEENYVVPDASSTSELVYTLLDYDRISLPVAEALYLGIVHDTGVFQYSSASPSTFRAAACLLEKGVDASRLIQKTYYEKTYAQKQVLGRALTKSRLLLDGKVIASYITREEMTFYGVDAKELDCIVSQLRDTTGVKIAVFMYELKEKEYKVSLRSNNHVDVNQIALHFGGGGHKKAAGCSLNGQAEEVLSLLMEEITLQLREEK